MSFFSAIGNFFHPTPKQQIATDTSIAKKVPTAGGFLNHYQQIRDLEGSMKKGGPVKKTGIYKLHKGEFVLNPRLAALVKSGEGPKLKGYAETLKTVPKLKYDRDKSLAYRERTGFFKTKIDSGGHTAGYKWAKKQEVSPKERKRKYGRNSPSFDEGVHEFKMRTRQAALESKKK